VDQWKCNSLNWCRYRKAIAAYHEAIASYREAIASYSPGLPLRLPWVTESNGRSNRNAVAFRSHNHDRRPEGPTCNSHHRKVVDRDPINTI
jgi:hypothetical protein